MDELSRVSKKSCIHFVDRLKESNKFLSHVDIDNVYKIFFNSFPEERFTNQYTPEFKEMTHDEILELVNKFQKRAADAVKKHAVKK